MSSPDGRLAELAERHALPGTALPALRAVLELLAADPTAPTTVTAAAAAVDVHVADSLSGLVVEPLRRAGHIADLGAGAGFPGLVLAAALPGASVSLVESVGRRCAFLDRALAASGLRNARVVCERAEGWEDGRERCDAVTARALAPLGVLVEYAAPLLRDGGVLVAYKGARDRDEEEAAARAGAIVGLECEEVVRVHPYTGAEHRSLHVWSKVAPTPARFPRRAGMARKRPL